MLSSNYSLKLALIDIGRILRISRIVITIWSKKGAFVGRIWDSEFLISMKKLANYYQS